MSIEIGKETAFADDNEFISPKIPEQIINNDELLVWAKFLNSSEKEEMEMLSNQNVGLKEAYKELISLSNDDTRRHIYESRKKAIMDYNVQQRAAKEEGYEQGEIKGKIEGKIEGIKEGEIKGKIEIAKKLLKKGLENSFISEMTELSLEEIEQLRNNI